MLSIAAIGNLWLKQHGTKYALLTSQAPARVPDPLAVANVIGAYENYLFQVHGSKTVKENYGLLSELSHPNAACLQQHHIHKAGGREIEIGDAEPISPLADETAIHSKITKLLVEIKKRAPVTRT